MEAAQEAAKKHPEDVAMQLLLGDCCLALGNGAAAMESYDAAAGLITQASK
jgi:cytochrome c-type biogenesis protein CcmH/NrfG